MVKKKNVSELFSGIGEEENETTIVKEETDKLSPLYMVPHMQQLNSINTIKNKPEVDGITGVASIEKGTTRFTIGNYEIELNELKISTQKLYTLMVKGLTMQNNHKEGDINKLNRLVSIPLDSYLEILGKEVTEKARERERKQVKQDLNTLRNLSISWRDKRKVKGKEEYLDHLDVALVETKGIKNGMIYLEFTPRYASYLIKNASISQIHEDIFKIDERNGNAWAIANKLQEHYFMESNVVRGINNKIKIKYLLPQCPNIPSYKEVMEAGKHVTQRIKEPLGQALSAISFITWEYTDENGKILTEDEVRKLSYEKFENVMIVYEFKDSKKLLTQIKDKGIIKKKKRSTTKKNSTLA